MRKGSKKELQKYLFWSISIILIFLSYLVIKKFIIPLLSAFILAYLIKPIYKKLNLKINSTLSALICIAIIILIVIIPLIILGTSAITQTASFAEDVNVKELFESIKTLPIIERINLDLTNIANSTVSLFAKLITQTLAHIPSLILGLVITLLGTFYILTKWETLAKELKKYIPFSKKDKIIKELKTTTNSIIYGLLLIASLELIVAAIGFYLLGIKFYIILSALIFFMAFFPGLGPTIIWAPILVYFIITKNIPQAIGTIVLGIILSGGIDLILRGKIMGSTAKINPLIMLVGIVGGISVFGIFGFIIGPLILVYSIKLIDEIIKN